MKKIHIAIATRSLEETIMDYTARLGAAPCVVLDEYALWRTESLNFSVRVDDACKAGELRHFGWEDPEASKFTVDTEVNGITWESFNAQQQAAEINEHWPEARYQPSVDL